MHYTSIENIHKVIDPLFLDDLKTELAKIEGERVEQKRIFLLRAFQNKLASLKIFDPACGSGNFLTESYIQLRHLENRVLANIQGDNQTSLSFEGELNPIKVSIDQFYGIEINDFAVSVAKAALWIAESQMIAETRDTVEQWIDVFPLSNISNIVEGNALRMDWNDVIPASECSYIIGNPPFVGDLTEEQRVDRETVFEKTGGVLDYVACWYRKSADYMVNTMIKAAFVSTNSITQGQQVEPLWRPLFDMGIKIIFAYQSFIWKNEAINQAHVHVVIIGFSYDDSANLRLYASNGESITASHINGYLQNQPNYFVTARSEALESVPEMIRGGEATDWGYFTLSSSEKDELLAQDPEAAKWIRSFTQGYELINNLQRYCLWFKDADIEEVESHPLLLQRIQAVKERRESSKKKATQKKAATPWLFGEIIDLGSDQYIAVPQVSSQRRKYLPIALKSVDCIPGNKMLAIPNGGIYEFGVLSSTMHNAWMRAVCGRMKSDYQYSATIVYNNFVWPDSTVEQKQKIEYLAQSILDIRDSYPNKSLADLYDPDKTPSDLLAAHKALDKAVEEAYGVDFDGDEEKIVAHLFKLYAEKAV